MADTFGLRADHDASRADRQALLSGLAGFQSSSKWRSLAQLVSTLTAYVATLAAMYEALQVSIWLTLAISVPAAGLMVRIFIIQHDCGHGSYFRSQRTNGIVGALCSIATFTPYAIWRRQHANHHAVWNNLDRRNSGADIYSTCLTLEEYLGLPTRRRWLYRMVRHPIIAQLMLPPFVFLLLYRTAFDTPKDWRKERRGVQLTNLALAAMLCGLAGLFGWQAVLMVQLPVIVFASVGGVWLFSVQHRFENAEWVRQDEWSAARAALNGSSYLKLPRILQWFTGNIGFHHIHHLLPRVPNYRLEACHKALLKQAGAVRVLSFSDALRAPSYALWDETHSRMVRFPHLPRATPR